MPGNVSSSGGPSEPFDSGYLVEEKGVFVEPGFGLAAVGR
jgi:hypothetical protein